MARSVVVLGAVAVAGAVLASSTVRNGVRDVVSKALSPEYGPMTREQSKRDWESRHTIPSRADKEVDGVHDDPFMEDDDQLLSALISEARAKFPLNATPVATRSYAASYAVTIKYLHNVLDSWSDTAKDARRSIGPLSRGASAEERWEWHRRVVDLFNEEVHDVPFKVADMRRIERRRFVEKAATYSFIPDRDIIAAQRVLRSRQSHARRVQLAHGRHSYWFDWLINSRPCRWWRGERQVHHFTDG